MENTNLQVFTNEQFGAVRTVILNGEPWFVAKDVAEWIEYSKSGGYYNVSRMLETVDEDEKLKASFNLDYEKFSHGGLRENTEAWFITEDGLYEVLMQSRKPIAKEFKRWLTSLEAQII